VVPVDGESPSVGPAHRDDHGLPLDAAAAVSGLRYTVGRDARPDIRSDCRTCRSGWFGGLGHSRGPVAEQRLSANALRSQGHRPHANGAIVLDVRTGTPVYAFNQHGVRSFLHHSRSSPSRTRRFACSARGSVSDGELVGVGARTGPVWHGSLGLVGYGDPTLTPADLKPYRPALRRHGIKSDRRTRVRRRHLLRREAGRPRLEALVPGDRIANRSRRCRSQGCRSRRQRLGRPAARALTEALEARGITITGRAGAGRAPSDAVPITFDLVAEAREASYRG
jgi:hypothetical protein